MPWRPLENGWVDFAFPWARLFIEVDGRNSHSRLDQMAEDRRRDRETALNKWVVLRYTWYELNRCPEMVVAEIRQALTIAA